MYSQQLKPLIAIQWVQLPPGEDAARQPEAKAMPKSSWVPVSAVASPLSVLRLGAAGHDTEAGALH